MEAVIAKGKLLCIGLGQSDISDDTPVGKISPTLFQHAAVDVRQKNHPRWPDLATQACRKVSRSAGNVQGQVPGPKCCLIEGKIFPEAMQPTRHQVVH
jgi:hypothetical protein